MKKPRVYMGIDIGTTKICAVIAQEVDSASPLEIVGYGIHPSSGLKDGTVVDLDVTATSIEEAARKAMNLAGVEVQKTVVGIAGGFVSSYNSMGSAEVASPERGITPGDVEKPT